MKLASSALVVVFATLAHPAFGQQSPGAERAVDIYAIIDRVADDIGKEFIVDPSIRTTRLPTSQEDFEYVTRPQAYSTADEIGYESLRALLRTIDFVAIESDDQVRIVPAVNARAEPSRILQQDDSRVSDHEIVTRTVTIPDGFSTGEFPAATLVPVLRPMMPQAAMLGAVPNTNTLVIVDYYDNVRRITALIEQIVGSLD